MILHKENSVKSIPFYESLIDLTEEKYGVRRNTTSIHKLYKEKAQTLEKYSYMVQNIIAFEEETLSVTNPELLAALLNKYVKKILPIKESALLFFDEEMLNLMPVNGNEDSQLVQTINHFYKEGVLNLLFDKGKEIMIPDLNHYNNNGSKLNFLLFPMFEENKKEGLLVVLTPLSEEKIEDLEKKSIQLLLNAVLAKIQKGLLKEKLNYTYKELQTYQAKLANDFRLAAIGELTNGILEDIMTPMQVIVSQLDMLKVEKSQDKGIRKIKRQINKISKSVDRLVKFSDINYEEIKIQPCKINPIIEEYFIIVKSTLESLNLETVLDLENRIPSILSHPNFIFQILTNVFGILSFENPTGGGIIIQTRYKSNKLVLRVISTNKIGDANSSNREVDYELNKNIIQKIMEKHEGELRIESFDSGGSAIIMTFPLIRRIRK